jgi:hypothetical protein
VGELESKHTHNTRQTKRRFRVQLTDSNHDLSIAPNHRREMERHTRRCGGRARDDTLATGQHLARPAAVFANANS